MRQGDFSGIQGIANQDIAMWESMGRGPIIDRSKEYLGGTDIAVVQWRRLMLDSLNDFQTNGTVLGQSQSQIAPAKIRAFDGIVPRGTNWEMLGLSEAELNCIPQDSSVVRDEMLSYSLDGTNI